MNAVLPDGPVLGCLGKNRRQLLVLDVLGSASVDNLRGGLGGLAGVPRNDLAPQGLLGLREEMMVQINNDKGAPTFFNIK